MNRLRGACLLLMALLILVAVGCGGTRTKTVTRAAPPPTLIPKPGATPAPEGDAPSCTPEEVQEVEAGKGHLGVCAPKPVAGSSPKVSEPPTVGRGETGPDFSNNDPISDWRSVKRHRHSFVYLKVIQGLRFIDRTARSMAAGARSAHVTPGGYDFLEVCVAPAADEAALFARELSADGLLRSPGFVPEGDAEWPLNVPCSAAAARAWLDRWQSALHARIHRWAGFYTGAWWANPNLGCWRPPHGGVRWISGYTLRRLLPIPCGWGGVDLWQFADNAFNGASHADMSVLETGVSKFTGGLTPAEARAAKLRSLRTHEATVRELHGDIDRHHCRKGKPWNGHASPRQYHSLCERWIRNGKRALEVIVRYKRELHIH